MGHGLGRVKEEETKKSYQVVQVRDDRGQQEEEKEMHLRQGLSQDSARWNSQGKENSNCQVFVSRNQFGCCLGRREE